MSIHISCTKVCIGRLILHIGVPKLALNTTKVRSNFISKYLLVSDVIYSLLSPPALILFELLFRYIALYFLLCCFCYSYAFYASLLPAFSFSFQESLTVTALSLIATV